MGVFAAAVLCITLVSNEKQQCVSACRVGGLLSPFAAVALVSSGAPAAAEGVFAAALVAACGAVVLVPGKHAGVGEQDMAEDVD